MGERAPVEEFGVTRVLCDRLPERIAGIPRRAALQVPADALAGLRGRGVVRCRGTIVHGVIPHRGGCGLRRGAHFPALHSRRTAAKTTWPSPGQSPHESRHSSASVGLRPASCRTGRRLRSDSVLRMAGSASAAANSASHFHTRSSRSSLFSQSFLAIEFQRRLEHFPRLCLPALPGLCLGHGYNAGVITGLAAAVRRHQLLQDRHPLACRRFGGDIVAHRIGCLVNDLEE